MLASCRTLLATKIVPVSAAMRAAGVPREAASGMSSHNAKVKPKIPTPSLKRHPLEVETSVSTFGVVMAQSPFMATLKPQIAAICGVVNREVAASGRHTGANHALHLGMK